VPKNQARV